MRKIGNVTFQPFPIPESVAFRFFLVDFPFQKNKSLTRNNDEKERFSSSLISIKAFSTYQQVENLRPHSYSSEPPFLEKCHMFVTRYGSGSKADFACRVKLK